MSYNGFAYWYDTLNDDADYNQLYHYLSDTIKKYSVKNNIMADLGCGTGELSVRFAKDGYDMISIDASADMLCVLQEKKDTLKLDNLMLLCQPLQDLDLYGSIGIAISTFDTFNHLTPDELDKALSRLSIFIEPNGLLIFDMNTPYKHTDVLGDWTFDIDIKNGHCEWENTLDIDNNRTHIQLYFYEEDKLCFTEDFFEYIYTLSDIKTLLKKYHFNVLDIVDGDTFEPLQEKSERFLIVAQKSESDDTWEN